MFLLQKLGGGGNQSLRKTAAVYETAAVFCGSKFNFLFLNQNVQKTEAVYLEKPTFFNTFFASFCIF